MKDSSICVLVSDFGEYIITTNAINSLSKDRRTKEYRAYKKWESALLTLIDMSWEMDVPLSDILPIPRQ